MNTRDHGGVFGLLVALALAATPAPAEVAYLYSLSGFSGTIPLNNARLFVDPVRDEVFVADGETVRIFNSSGMETYRFGDGQGMGSALDLAVNQDGDIFALNRDPESPADHPRFRILHRDYRGEPKAEIELRGLPPEFAAIRPNRMAYRDGRFWLVSRPQLLAVAVDESGTFERGIDLATVLEIPDGERADHEISGFALDRTGHLLLAVPVLFRVFVVSPEGQHVASFGKVGSAPGLFGVIAGLAADDADNVYVADRLRSVVMVFDRDRRFVSEFGYMGPRPENLVRPTNLALGPGGKLYVTQLMNRGVSVFSAALDAR